MRNRKILSAVAFASLIAANSAYAQHAVEYGIQHALGDKYMFEHYEVGEQSVGPVFDEHIIPNYGRIASTANVGFGVNKARVDLSGTNPANPLVFDYGFATTTYYDSFTFSDPDLNGQHGFFETQLYVAGAGSVNLSQSFIDSPNVEFDAFWHAVLSVEVEGVEDPDGNPIQSGVFAGEWYKGFDSNELEYFGDPLNTYQQTLTFEFIWGQPIYMDSFLQVMTFMDNQDLVAGTLDASIDLGNSTYWGGVRNLRDANGNLITDAGYSSSSGFDYRTSSVVVTGNWTGGGANTSWATSANWANAAIPNGANHVANFTAAGTSPRTVTIDSAGKTVGAVAFDSDGTFTIGGVGTLALDVTTGEAAVNVARGNHTISAPISLAKDTTFTITPANSVLTASGALNAAGRTITKAGAGALRVTNIRAAALNVNAGTVGILANGTSAGASRVATLTLGATARLDLTDNDLMVNSGAYSDIAGAIRAARNGGAWDQPGITSSTAAAAVVKNKTLGVLTGAQLISTGVNGFNGFAVSPSDTLVKFTYYGDSDFNGIVNFDDYARIDGGFNSGGSGGGSDWFHGDFDLNNTVNFDDYALIDLAFNSQGGTLVRAMDFLEGEDRSMRGMDAPELQTVVDHFAQFGNQYAASFLSAVPEPTSALILVGVVAAATMRVRRRRHGAR